MKLTYVAILKTVFADGVHALTNEEGAADTGPTDPAEWFSDYGRLRPGSLKRNPAGKGTAVYERRVPAGQLVTTVAWTEDRDWKGAIDRS